MMVKFDGSSSSSHHLILHLIITASSLLLIQVVSCSAIQTSFPNHHDEVHRKDRDTKVEKVEEREGNEPSFHGSDFETSKYVPLDSSTSGQSQSVNMSREPSDQFSKKVPLDSSFSGQLESATVSRESSDELRRRVERENYVHVSEAIDSLLNVERMSFESSSSNADEVVKLVDESKQFDELKFSSSGDYHVLDNEGDIGYMNQTYMEMLNKPRCDSYSRSLKETARNNIIGRLKEYKLETFTQSFTASKRGSTYKGTNIIGILPGRFRGLPDKDHILLLGAHYDTVETSPGIDDNGSGVVATLEVARILSNRPQLNHTVIFTAFDLEELGLLGSLAFVREYLIPVELLKNKSKFLGAYIIDMVLNYDSSPGSQTLPRDIVIGTPEVSRKIAQDGDRGDFVACWTRKGIDSDVFNALASEWKGSTGRSLSSSAYKLRPFEPNLPSTSPSANDLYRYGTYTRSDHASFWYHKHPTYKSTLHAVLLTDMGPWRGANRKCYHSWCDDASQLTSKNLNFLKNTIDTLANVLSKNPPKTSIVSIPDPPILVPSESDDSDERSFFPPMNFPPTSFANIPSRSPGAGRAGRGQPQTTTRIPFIIPRNWWKLQSNF